MIVDLLALLWTQETPTAQFGKMPMQTRVSWYKFKNEIYDDMPELTCHDVDYPDIQEMKNVGAMVLVDSTHVGIEKW